MCSEAEAAQSQENGPGVSLQAGTTVPVLSGWDLVLTARNSEFDDVGNTSAWRVASRYRPNDALTLRTHWTYSEGAPGLSDLNKPKSINAPYICDTRAQPCSVQQVDRESGGNRNLKPSESNNANIGATLRFGELTIAADWYRSESDGTPAQVSPQHLVNLDVAGKSLAGWRGCHPGRFRAYRKDREPAAQQRREDNAGRRAAGRRRPGNRLGRAGHECQRSCGRSAARRA